MHVHSCVYVASDYSNLQLSDLIITVTVDPVNPTSVSVFPNSLIQLDLIYDFFVSDLLFLNTRGKNIYMITNFYCRL